MIAPALEVQRAKMRDIARDMRAELAELQAASVKPLEGGPEAGHTVGGWDVAQRFGTSVDGSHQAMIGAFQRFIAAYEEVIARIDTAEQSYRNAEGLTMDIIKKLDLEWALPDVGKWRQPNAGPSGE